MFEAFALNAGLGMAKEHIQKSLSTVPWFALASWEDEKMIKLHSPTLGQKESQVLIVNTQREWDFHASILPTF